MKRRRIALFFTSLTVLAGCVHTAQLTRNTEATDFSLDAVAFHEAGLGFLTPVSATGQEADRVALALAFADAVDAARDDVQVVRLAEVPSAVKLSFVAAQAAANLMTKIPAMAPVDPLAVVFVTAE